MILLLALLWVSKAIWFGSLDPPSLCLMFSVGSGTDRGPISELPTIDLSRHTELTKTIRGMKKCGAPCWPKRSFFHWFINSICSMYGIFNIYQHLPINHPDVCKYTIHEAVGNVYEGFVGTQLKQLEGYHILIAGSALDALLPTAVAAASVPTGAVLSAIVADRSSIHWESHFKKKVIHSLYKLSLGRKVTLW